MASNRRPYRVAVCVLVVALLSMGAGLEIQKQKISTSQHHKTKFIGGLVKGISNGVKNVASSVTGAISSGLGALVGSSRAARTEDCTACKYVWGKVEMEVSNTRSASDVQSAFERVCMDAQRTRIFYKPCEMMFDDLYAFIDDYLSGMKDINSMCRAGKMCRLL